MDSISSFANLPNGFYSSKGGKSWRYKMKIHVFKWRSLFDSERFTLGSRWRFVYTSEDLYQKKLCNIYPEATGGRFIYTSKKLPKNKGSCTLMKTFMSWTDISLTLCWMQVLELCAIPRLLYKFQLYETGVGKPFPVKE